MQARVPHQNPLYREEPLYRGERRSFLILDFAPELPSVVLSSYGRTDSVPI